MIKNYGKVGVLAGGPSNEREVSLRSGKAVFNALLKEGVDAVFVDVRDDLYDIIKNTKIDAAFIALHGRFGEDGTVQKMLEDARIPYTGSGVSASKQALDKIATKEIFIRSGIPTPKYKVFNRNYTVSDIDGCVDRLGLPLVVKPQFEGSSIGLSVVKESGLLKAALDKAFEYGDNVMVEEYISGRELTVGILDENALPVIEVVTRNNFYDYEAKYSDPQTRYLVPAPIEERHTKNAQQLGVRSHASLGCRCLSRVDMIMNGEGDMFVLEVNTIPGMTERSLLPKAAGAAGLSFGALCITLIESAIKVFHETAKED